MADVMLLVDSAFHYFDRRGDTRNIALDEVIVATDLLGSFLL